MDCSLSLIVIHTESKKKKLGELNTYPCHSTLDNNTGSLMYVRERGKIVVLVVVSWVPPILYDDKNVCFPRTQGRGFFSLFSCVPF